VERQPESRERILILAPTGRDADLAARALAQAGLTAGVCPTIESFCASIVEGAGAGILTEEALSHDAMACLREAIEKQPAWSDFPLMIFTSKPASESGVTSFEAAGPRANITLIERPVRVKTMISAAETALRARRRQYEVRDLLDELHHRVDERDQFLAMLSHELRNPLAAISLALTGLQDEDELGTNEREILIRQTRHLTKLVDDLLDIGRVTSGKITLHRTPVDLADIVQHCFETLRPRAESRGLTLQTHFNPNLPIPLSGDVVRLEQIVNNLLSNALKYTPAGGTIDIYLDQHDGQAVLRVCDTGKGIAPELLGRVFDLFMQGEVSIDRSEGGLGIGLTLVRKLVELHGGSVQAESDGSDRGSRFTVRLPLAAFLTPHAPEPLRRLPVVTEPRHILVVEDNADVRTLLRAKLRQLGHSVDVAEDGFTAVEKILERKHDVALIDIGLPGIDGYEVARRARAELGHDVFLIALTGYGRSEDRSRAMDAGFDAHLTKPADLSDLQRVLGGR
jgi:signal transduction histidine kinase